MTTRFKKSVITFVLERPRLLRTYLRVRTSTPLFTVRRSLTSGTDAGAKSVRKLLDQSGLTSDYSEPYKDKRNG